MLRRGFAARFWILCITQRRKETQRKGISEGDSLFRESIYDTLDAMLEKSLAEVDQQAKAFA